MNHRMLCGLEQEYGIVAEGPDEITSLHPMHLSNLVIRGYRDATTSAQVGFDFASEAPLTDQWGFQLDREAATEDMLTHENPMANRVLTNGARFYVDHAHPEYSGPEVTSARDAALYDRVGDVIMQQAADAVFDQSGVRIRLYKNNTDSKGASYGTHENYLLPRSLPFDDVVASFTGFVASRGIVSGAGRVGRGRNGEATGFQLTQRADFFERTVGLETTVRRPLINTRDEPHGNARFYRRLHVITGDANMSQFACWLKVGTAALVLAAIVEGGVAPQFADPVSVMREGSHDVDLQRTYACTDGTARTLIQMQWEYHAMAAALEDLSSWGDEASELLKHWARVLETLASSPTDLVGELDWVTKLHLVEGYRRKLNAGWGDARLAALDLLYADIDPKRSLALKMEARGQLRTVVSPADVQAAIAEPPTSTRALLRGRLLSGLGEAVRAIGWDQATLSDARGRHRTLRLGDPLDVPSDRTLELLALGNADEVIAHLLQ